MFTFIKQLVAKHQTAVARRDYMENRRALLADGTIALPRYEKPSKLIQAMPGWNAVTSHVSLLEQDRRRLLELAKQENLEIAPELRLPWSDAARFAYGKKLYP